MPKFGYMKYHADSISHRTNMVFWEIPTQV